MYTKKGIDYRPENCYLDDNTRLMISAIGVQGYGVYTFLLNKIYGEQGYYTKWTSDIETLFALQIGLKKATVSECVSYLIAHKYFDEYSYKKYKILTSREIQQEYERVAYKRVNKWHTPQYVLLSTPKIQNDSKLTQNDSNSGKNDNKLDTEKRTAKQSESENESYSESETGDIESPAISLAKRLGKRLRNKDLQIDINTININALCNAVLESDFLQKAENLDIDWLVNHYDDVINGKYKTITTKELKNNDAVIRQRQYTQEDYTNVFKDIDDFIN